MQSRRRLCITTVLMFVAVCGFQVYAQTPSNPGIFKQYPGRLSSTTRFWASDAGKEFLLHSPSPAAFPMLQKFHPDAASQYPLQPMFPAVRGNAMRQSSPVGYNSVRPGLTVTGCGSTTGTVMNLEPAANAVAQNTVSIDFLLSELGSGLDLVVETANDQRGFDSFSAEYVHRDPTQPCYGGSDFEVGNPPIPDPFYAGTFLFGEGNARVVADPNPAHKQFIFADLRIDGTTTGVGLVRTPAGNFESTTTCPQGTLMGSQEATCIGSTAVIVDASLDNEADSISIAQDPRSSGTGAGDIYVINGSIRVLRSVIDLSACKATFTTSADCSHAVIVSGSQTIPQFPSVAVVGGGPNAGDIVLSWFNPDDETIDYAYCTPGGAPNPPTCHGPSVIYTDFNLYSRLTDLPGIDEIPTWPVIAARTDTSGQTIFVVFSDCKVSPFLPPLSGCVDADVQLQYATNLTSPTWTLVHVNTNGGHQAIPAIAYDTGQNIVTIGYYDTGTSLYKNITVQGVNQIASGTTTIEGEVHLNSAYDAVQGDGTSFIPSPGDYIGVAAHGGSGTGSSRLYVGFTSNARIGRYDTIANTQADNDVLRATY